VTKKPVSNVGGSVRQRLLNLRDQTGEDAHALFTQFAIERFLYRLSRSSLAGRFVLKGAMLFRVWSGSLHRPTKDVDLLGFGEPAPASVAAMIRQIINTAVEDDGITFDAASIRAEEIRENDDYGGIRATVTATLDKAIIPLQVDVGFGDAITPAAEDREYPVLVGMAAPKLRMYPVETVIAEKLEAAVKLGIVNSRMKDFYDLLALSRLFGFDGQTLVRAIIATFTRRTTAVPATAPEGLSATFAADPQKQRQWEAFVGRESLLAEPLKLSDTLDTIAEFALPPLKAAAMRAPFISTWAAGGPWRS